MLKHASPQFSAAYGEPIPYMSPLTKISSNEALDMDGHDSQKSFAKAPGFFMRSSAARAKARKQGPSMKMIIPRRKPESKDWTVDKGSPRPLFHQLEERLNHVSDHWKRKAWTKGNRLDPLNIDGEKLTHVSSPIESLELEGKLETTGEEDNELPKSLFFDGDQGGGFLSDADNDSEPITNTNTEVARQLFNESLEDSLSHMPSGMHLFDSQLRHRIRTQSGRDAEILMAGKDEMGTTLLVKYGDSDALQLRSLNSVQPKTSARSI